MKKLCSVLREKNGSEESRMKTTKLKKERVFEKSFKFDGMKTMTN